MFPTVWRSKTTGTGSLCSVSWTPPPASCQLNQAFVERVRQPIHRVWNSIAADMMDDEDIDNENVIEWCIDADHLELIAYDKEANDLVREQCKIHGYTRVLKFLSKHISLY